LKFMHSRNPKIIHRDLKSPNILMASLNENDAVVCKVSDFGESLAAATKALGREKLANPVWCSPEMMKGESYNEKADVFSFGIVLWELAARKMPYDEFEVSKSKFMSALEDAIIKGLRPTIPSDCPIPVRDLIRECWQADPDLRPNFDEIYITLGGIRSTINSDSTLMSNFSTEPVPFKSSAHRPVSVAVGVSPVKISQVPPRKVVSPPPRKVVSPPPASKPPPPSVPGSPPKNVVSASPQRNVVSPSPNPPPTPTAPKPSVQSPPPLHPRTVSTPVMVSPMAKNARSLPLPIPPTKKTDGQT